jgi:hypothetical protein
MALREAGWPAAVYVAVRNNRHGSVYRVGTNWRLLSTETVLHVCIPWSEERLLLDYIEIFVGSVGTIIGLKYIIR